MTYTENRRRCERIPYPESGVTTVIVGASTDNYSAQDIQVVDFSRSGLGIQSGNRFAVGDTLQLDMSLSGGPPLHLNAVICNRRQGKNSYRYGAFFEYEVLPTTRESGDVLEQVEMDLSEMRSGR
ncbi:MAG: hypothetical protein AseanaTS_30040 [Candidatus Pelagadaptatus aseana]|uniref:PilZ domain-containing protein n=1 Tax=Candidatus Pelagadaptatus aseana TaxID=3120508 RepID=UPI0039B335CA